MDSFFSTVANSFVTNLIAEQRYQMILEGLQVTLLITLCAAVLGTLLGGLVCWARMSRRPWLQRTAKVYIDLMRGTPVLVLMMLMYYVFMAPIETTGVIVAIITFAINTSAYIGETLRAGIESIDRGQREAGLALGYTPRQVFGRIILPQVVRKIMPVYLGEVISLLKGTSIVGYIAVVDMTRASDLIRSRTFDAFFPLIVTAAIYFLVAWLIGLLLNGLVEKRKQHVAWAAVMLVLLGSLGWMSDLFSQTNGDRDTMPPMFRYLEGKKIGLVVGSIQDIAVTRYMPDEEMLRFTSVTDLITSLTTGKTDIIVAESIVITANRELVEGMDTIDVGLPPVEIAACMKLSNTELQEDFNRFIAEIRADGTFQRLHDKWLVQEDISLNPIPKQLGTGKKIKVGIFPSFPPFNFIRIGEPSGYEIDFLTEWANRRNYQLEFLVLDFAAQIPAVQTGKTDMAMGLIAVTAERQKNVLFSDGYHQSRMMFCTRKGEWRK